ncbi:PAS domain-containing protein [Duganella sp. FT50W]|uniref:histidine kinase n=1 Tax=Duganella lactea TaxID=2692173 RepID=A0A6L8MJ03_9BURK|nr:ATP-binding protein [Duganella lactea]MYM83130.1 PAS domain-containing protein [Duganella lactea]
MPARPPALPAASRATFWRSLQTLNATRVVIALLLLAYLSLGNRAGLDRSICLLYLALAIGFALSALFVRRRFMLQLLSPIACDLAIISLLYLAGGGIRSGLAILYLFPLAGLAILAPLLVALFCASLVSLFLLGDSAWHLLLADTSERDIMSAGLYGAVLLAAVLVVNRLAARLIGQEALASRRGVEIAVQQAVNRLVMANIGDGILVVDPQGQVHASNPAAQRMLGLAGLEQLARPFSLSEAVALAPLTQAYAHWRADSGRATTLLTLRPYNDAALAGVTAAWRARRDLAVYLKVRFAAAETQGLGAERGVIFLQDMTDIEHQAQQLKLASMGRLTASIAHEVRNPLSAIAHATALLAEEVDAPLPQRLLSIVGDNVARVNRMVEDILQLSRKAQVPSEPLALDGFLAALRAEFSETHGLAPDLIAVSVAPGALVRFDALHLREVLLNLLSNALRYASGGPASIRLSVVADTARRLELHVQDDGPGITPEARAHLFEPFYTTAGNGNGTGLGLGLYLARELCLNNEARLDYEYRFNSDGGADGPSLSGRFVITLKAAG